MERGAPDHRRQPHHVGGGGPLRGGRAAHRRWDGERLQPRRGRRTRAADLPETGWAEDALRSLDRFHAVVVGPGLGRRDEMAASARYMIINAPLPVVVDGDGLFALAWNAARDTNCVVLLKGPTTVVAEPHGEVLVVTTGDHRLATAGTGDVLAGVVGSLLAHGLPPFQAAAMGAWVHGRAARLGAEVGFVASDLPELIPQVLASL
jgi:NAD(P)H-hydrate epimerase